MIKKQNIFIVILVLFFFGNCLRSDAASVKKAFTEIDLISAQDSLQPGKPIWVAIHMKLDEHWHTYWMNPGDVGFTSKIIGGVSGHKVI